jgi:hypothetical protein
LAVEQVADLKDACDEVILVLEGSLRDDRGTYGPGDTYYVPVPVVPEARQLIGHDGRRIPTMEEYVASQAVPPPPPGE